MGQASAKCMSAARLDGKTAIITGSNTGIGKATAQDFFKRGARVILACRSAEKANAAGEEIRSSCSDQENVGEFAFTHLDLTSLQSVRNCAQQLLQSEERIDLLVNNAGVMLCPQGGHLDFDDLNFEKRSYSAMQAYSQSKLANILFTQELARRTQDAHVEGLTVYSLHPGIIHTELGRHLDETYFWGMRYMLRMLTVFFTRSPEQGAQTTIYCALDENCGNETGLYYFNCQVTEPSLAAKNIENAKKLWNESLKLVGLTENYNPFASKP